MTARLGVNEYGTPVSVHTCTGCGREFTVCPADTEGTFGDECLEETCPTYDITRDVSLFWDAATENGLIGRRDL